MTVLTDKELCYFTTDAKMALTKLKTEFNLDQDLAVAVLETLWPEEHIYDLTGDE